MTVPGGRWVKGVSGNPGGRKPRDEERNYYRTMTTHCTIDKWAEICKKAVEDAIAGDRHAREWLGKYLMGIPAQRIDFGLANETEIVIRIIESATADFDEIVDGEGNTLIKLGPRVDGPASLPPLIYRSATDNKDDPEDGDESD